MKNKFFRAGIVLLAIVLGVVIAILIVYTGDTAKGPMEDLMDQVGRTTMSIDKYFSQRDLEERRAKKLSWFDPYRTSKEKLSKPDTLLLGVYKNQLKRTLEPIVDFEEQLNVKLPLIHFYVAWGSKPTQQFPYRKCTAIYDLGSVPVITWEPWLNDFDKGKYPYIPNVSERDKGGLRDIAHGMYDFYLQAWVEDLKEFDKIIMIRLGHEMNDPYRYPWGPQNNKPEDFVAAWRYIHQYFEERNVDNVIWIWSPHIAYKPYAPYYPGDEYVDWLGVGVLNYGTVAPWSKWWTFHQIFGNQYEDLAEFGEPIMLSEFGCLEVGGNRAHWYESAIKDMNKHYPLVRSILFFNSDADITTTSKSLDWSLEGDTAAIEAIRTGLENWGK